MLVLKKYVAIFKMVSMWRISFILASTDISKGLAKENKYTKSINDSNDVGQTSCKADSTHPKKLFTKNVCLTKDYSKFDEPNESNRTHLGIVFLNHQAVNVDDKKKEITLEVSALIHWKDERIKAFFSPHRNYIQLPPIMPQNPPRIWTPFTKIEIPNIRNIKYLRNPTVANFRVQQAEHVNGMFKNDLFPSNFPIVQSYIKWSISIHCQFQFSKFPFDENSCPFVLRFWDTDISLGVPKSSWESWKGLKGHKEKVDFKEKEQKEADGFKIEVKQIHPSNTSFDGFYFTDVELFITIKRQSTKYIYQYYIPCITIVIASSFSFIIPLSAIPGRVALIVTQFLTLTNIFINQIVSIRGQ